MKKLTCMLTICVHLVALSNSFGQTLGSMLANVRVIEVTDEHLTLKNINTVNLKAGSDIFEDKSFEIKTPPGIKYCSYVMSWQFQYSLGFKNKQEIILIRGKDLPVPKNLQEVNLKVDTFKEILSEAGLDFLLSDTKLKKNRKFGIHSYPENQYLALYINAKEATGFNRAINSLLFD